MVIEGFHIIIDIIIDFTNDLSWKNKFYFEAKLVGI